MNSNPLTLALAVLAVTCTSAAQADTSVSATLSNLRITLVDLRPDDGIAPAIQFLNSGYGGTTEVSVQGDSDLQDPTRATSSSPLAFLDASIGPHTGPAYTVEAGISGDPLKGVRQMSAAGTTTRASWEHPVNSPYTGNSVELSASDSVNFSLSPDTLMIVTATANATASVAALTPLREELSTDAYALASLALLVTTAHGREQRVAAVDAGDGLSGNFSDRQQGELNVSFANTLTTWAAGSLSDFVTMSSSESISTPYPGTVSGVPEPTSSSLLVAGLGAVGWFARRRRNATPR